MDEINTQNIIDCEFIFCIYNKNNKCVLNGIKISNTGGCDSCTIPDFPEWIIETYKKTLLEKLNS